MPDDRIPLDAPLAHGTRNEPLRPEPDPTAAEWTEMIRKAGAMGDALDRLEAGVRAWAAGHAAANQLGTAARDLLATLGRPVGPGPIAPRPPMIRTDRTHARGAVPDPAWEDHTRARPLTGPGPHGGAYDPATGTETVELGPE